KEAIAKALGSPGGMRWHDCTVHRGMHEPPRVEITGTVLAAAESRGITSWHLSISHDAGIATAFVIAEGRCRAPTPLPPSTTPKPPPSPPANHSWLAPLGRSRTPSRARPLPGAGSPSSRGKVT